MVDILNYKRGTYPVRKNRRRLPEQHKVLCNMLTLVKWRSGGGGNSRSASRGWRKSPTRVGEAVVVLVLAFVIVGGAGALIRGLRCSVKAAVFISTAL